MKDLPKTLKDIQDAFMKEDGSEYYKTVSFANAETVFMEGEFTVRQLRMIADAMDAAKETEQP